MIYWFTGQPGSGKTTLARAWASELGCHVIDGDDLRVLFPESYDEAGRRRNVDRAQTIARFLGTCCVALIAPYRDQREEFKSCNPVVEVYLIGSPGGKEEFWVDGYEPPLEPDIAFDTDTLNPEDCLGALRTIHRTLATFS